VALVLAAVAIASAILSTVAAMYNARQVTRRKEIECRSTDALAGALARAMDDAHARARDSSAREAWEVERVRTSSRQLTSEVIPLLAAMLQLRPQQDGRPAKNRRR
jgi:hypothetical protein